MVGTPKDVPYEDISCCNNNL